MKTFLNASLFAIVIIYASELLSIIGQIIGNLIVGNKILEVGIGTNRMRHKNGIYLGLLPLWYISSSTKERKKINVYAPIIAAIVLETSVALALIICATNKYIYACGIALLAYVLLKLIPYTRHGTYGKAISEIMQSFREYNLKELSEKQ